MASKSFTAISIAAGKDPFRVFFPFGAALAIVGVLPWTAQVFGVSTYPVEFHKALMVNGFLLSFVSGFLMTAVPRFTSSSFATAPEICGVFCAILGGALAALFGVQSWSHVAAVIALLTLAIFGGRRFTRRKTNPPFTFVFVGGGVLLWAIANCFLFLADRGAAFALGNIRIWQDLHSTGAVMAMVLGVGGRLIPGILGWQEIVNTQRNRYEGKESFMAAVPSSIWALLGGYLLSFALLNALPLRACLTARAIVICYFAFRFWKIHRVPFDKTYLTWCIWLSCWCFVIGAILTLVWPKYYAHLLHLSLIGGFSLLTVLIATRVTLAHGADGKGPEKTWSGIYVFSALMLLAAVTRATAILLPERYLHHLGYAAITWTIGFSIWAIAMIPRMYSGLWSSSVTRK